MKTTLLPMQSQENLDNVITSLGLTENQRRLLTLTVELIFLDGKREGRDEFIKTLDMIRDKK